MSGEFSIKPIEPDTPEYRAAKERAAGIIEEAHLNEAIRVIARLLDEVSTMPIAARFSLERKAWAAEGEPPGIAPHFHDLSEQEYKREQLKLDLERLREEITRAVTNLEGVVMDIEATKIE